MSTNLNTITTTTAGILASAQMTSGVNTIYTVPAASSAQIGSLVLANVSAAVVTVNAGIVPSGGTADGTHDLVTGISIAAGETVILDEFAAVKWMRAGDAIMVKASAAAAINATIAGLVFS